MATTRVGWVVAALLATACGKPGEPAAATDARVSDEKWGEVFPAYPGARLLCGQHVAGNTMHIQWTAYATRSAKAAVIAFYEQHRGALSVERPDGGLMLRGPGDRVLSVHAKDESYPRCDVPPAAEDATVIIVSQAIR
jgi:hypothetical protein